MAEKSPAPSTILQGVNRVLGHARSTALEGTVVKESASSEVRCSVSLGIEELASSLSIDQSLSAGFGPMGSVDQKLDFVRSLKVTTTSVVLSVYSSRVKHKEAVINVSFKSGAKISADMDAFVKVYGDSYVSSLKRGAEYIGIYVFYSQTTEDQRELVGKLSASGVFAAAKVDASLQIKVDSFLKSTTVDYTFRQWATGCDSKEFPGPDGFIDFALKFSSLEWGSLLPPVIWFDVAGYESVEDSESVPGFRSSFEKVEKNRNYFCADDGLTRALIALTQLSNQIRWLESVYDVYGYEADLKLAEFSKTVNGEIAAVNGQMKLYGDKPTGDFPPLVFNCLTIGYPVLGRPIVAYGPVWGGEGGEPFNDVDLRTFIQRKGRIAEIGLRGGNRVDRLSVTYDYGPGDSKTFSHGGSGGADRGSLQLLEGEKTFEISGRSGSRLDRVEFTLSGGRSLAAGSNSGGSSFGPWKRPEGSFVMGFRGRSGTEMDALQVIYASLTPARWLSLPNPR